MTDIRMSDAEVRYRMSLMEHANAYRDWVNTMFTDFVARKVPADQRLCDVSEWVTAAEQIYIRAGGLDAFRDALHAQRAMAPDDRARAMTEQDEMVKRLATAQYIRDGGERATMQAAQAYCAAAARAARMPEHRVWRRARRECNRKLLNAVRGHVRICAEISWADTLTITRNVNEYLMSERGRSKNHVEHSQYEFLCVLGLSSGMRELLDAR